MINEKKMIEEIADFKRCQKSENCDYLAGYISALSAVEGMIEKQPKVGEWIPIGQYPCEPSLLCFENGEMVVGYYDYDAEEWNVQASSEYFSCLDISDDEPIAYMSLPELYREKVEE